VISWCTLWKITLCPSIIFVTSLFSGKKNNIYMSSLLKKEGYIDFPLCCGRIYMNDGPLFVFKTTEESIVLEFYIH
jgi:hypothetical protein